MSVRNVLGRVQRLGGVVARSIHEIMSKSPDQPAGEQIVSCERLEDRRLCSSVLHLAGPVQNHSAHRALAIPVSINVNGTASADVIYIRRDGVYLDQWVNSAHPGQGTPTQQDALTGTNAIKIDGGGGNDTIVIDESGGDILSTPTTLADTNGAASVVLVGTSATDTLVFKGDEGSLAFNSETLTFSNVVVFTYWDSNSVDNVESSGAIAVTLDVHDVNLISNNSGDVTMDVIDSGAMYSPGTPAVTPSAALPSANAHRGAPPRRHAMDIHSDALNPLRR